jgi:hypothetical protein
VDIKLNKFIPENHSFIHDNQIFSIMKNHTFFKRALISCMGLVIILNCTAQTHKEKRAERSELKETEQRKNFESLGSLIYSRNFEFKSGRSESRQVGDLYESQEHGKSAIRINGSLVRITGLNSSEWWKTTSCTIDNWELIENRVDLSYSISFIARSGDSNTAILIKVLNDKTAIAQFGGREFRGQVTRN